MIAVERFNELRLLSGLDRKPGTAELINWVAVLIRAELDARKLDNAPLAALPFEGDFSQAILEAESVQRISPTRAWRIIGAAACNMKDVKLVSDAYRNLDEASRQYLMYTCQRQGIIKTGKEFKLTD